MRKTKVITTVFRTKASGRSRTSRTRVRSFVPTIGCSIKKSIAASPTRLCRKWKAANRRSFMLRKARRFGATHFLQNRVGEAAIDFLILQPIVGTKDRARVRDVRERPEAFV